MLRNAEESGGLFTVQLGESVESRCYIEDEAFSVKNLDIRPGPSAGREKAGKLVFSLPFCL